MVAKMPWPMPRTMACALGAFLCFCAGARAAPEVSALSPRGLQAGATTTLTVDGTDLLPAPRLLLSAPVAAQAVRPGATAARVQLDVTLAADVPPGLYLARIANERGISNALPLAVDDLAQLPFA